MTNPDSEPKYEMNHQFKLAQENKFLYMELPQIESIVGQTYLTLQPSDPPPIGRTLRFYDYDVDTAALVAAAKKKPSST